MSDSVVIILKRPEGYEDVCAELVAEDFLKNNGAGLEYEATEATKDTTALLDEMAEVLEDIVEYVDCTFASTEMNNLCKYAKMILQKYREQKDRK